MFTPKNRDELARMRELLNFVHQNLCTVLDGIPIPAYAAPDAGEPEWKDAMKAHEASYNQREGLLMGIHRITEIDGALHAKFLQPRS